MCFPLCDVILFACVSLHSYPSCKRSIGTCFYTNIFHATWQNCHTQIACRAYWWKPSSFPLLPRLPSPPLPPLCLGGDLLGTGCSTVSRLGRSTSWIVHMAPGAELTSCVLPLLVIFLAVSFLWYLFSHVLTWKWYKTSLGLRVEGNILCFQSSFQNGCYSAFNYIVSCVFISHACLMER